MKGAWICLTNSIARSWSAEQNLQLFKLPTSWVNAIWLTLDIRALPLLQRQLRTSSTNLMPLKRATKRVLSGIHYVTQLLRFSPLPDRKTSPKGRTVLYTFPIASNFDNVSNVACRCSLLRAAQHPACRWQHHPIRQTGRLPRISALARCLASNRNVVCCTVFHLYNAFKSKQLITTKNRTLRCLYMQSIVKCRVSRHHHFECFGPWCNYYRQLTEMLPLVPVLQPLRGA